MTGTVLAFPTKVTARGIDICSKCHFSRYTDELRVEWIPTRNPELAKQFPSELVLTCRECEAKR